MKTIVNKLNLTIQRGFILGFAVAYEPATKYDGGTIYIAIPFFVFDFTLNKRQ